MKIVDPDDFRATPERMVAWGGSNGGTLVSQATTVSNGQIAKHQYWDLRFDVSPRWTRFDEAVEALEHLLRRTVNDHMISDVPVGGSRADILLHGIEAGGPRRESLPRYLSGFAPQSRPETRYALRLIPPPEDLPALQRRDRRARPACRASAWTPSGGRARFA
jgi:hypothetical protein